MRTSFAIAAAALAMAVPGIMISVPAVAAEHVVNGTFDADAAPWWGTQNLTLDVHDGALCTMVPGKTINPWDAIVGENDIHLVKGEGYTFNFRAKGDPKGPVRALVQMPVDPYTSYASATPTATPAGEVTSVSFTSPVDIEDAQIVFQVGGSPTDWTLCLDEVSLQGGTAVAAYVPETGPRVRVNQVGYLPDGPKHATIVTDAAEALDFALEDASGTSVFSGKTVPRGLDPTAGMSVHTADFSGFAGTGAFTLSVDGEQSYPFRIGPDIYAALPVDALSYYYPVRSGIEIKDEIAGAGYGRPAGHLGSPGKGSVNQGDLDVPCQKPEVSQQVYGEPWTCGYTLDAVGGWYDAGDHGKYVVNGGISVAQLLATYERARRNGARAGDKTVLGDGSLRIPEAGNGMADVLDEALWELQFFLEMTVPAKEPMAGMVHHKLHDAEWTGIPLLPSNDPKVRELHRPSTAATLNVAATMAQAARLYDPALTAFPSAALQAAEETYAAALANPAVLAPAADGNSGGGPYDDADVSDEFYWAAAELFISTGEQKYYDALKASPHWAGDVFRPQGFDWGHVQGFARLELATNPEHLSADDAAAIRRSVLDAADGFLVTAAGEPFGQPYAPPDGKYDWGSNHLVIQNALVMAVAYDLSGEQKYRQGALEAMDYIFGRNALNMSYVTGYGTQFSHNQHSRWFAHSASADLPSPPRGALSGGPNSSIQDPVAQGLFAKQGCAAQTCYTDNIESWSTNEITINWNAALSQMAGWLADQ